MSPKNILLQLDSDLQASSFDSIVALDGGADHLLCHGQVALDQVQALVHGTIFTRRLEHLKHTAIFIGGQNVAQGEKMLTQVKQSFVGPFCVSVMLDANGANTTAAAAVICASKHLDLSQTRALVLAGTGPVGQRSARLLAHEGATVRLASRSLQRAQAAAKAVNQHLDGTPSGGGGGVSEVSGASGVSGVSIMDDEQLTAALEGVELVIAAGAAGIELCSQAVLERADAVKVAIDLNAVPPLGIESVQIDDRATDRHGVMAYGAIGVGGTKMKIHKAAIARLFEDNQQVLDALEIYAIGQSLYQCATERS